MRAVANADKVRRFMEVHYDPVGQVLAKIERGHARDLVDARELVARGLAPLEALEHYFTQTRKELLRYPALDADVFEGKVQSFVAQVRGTKS